MSIFSKNILLGTVLTPLTILSLATPAHALSSESSWLSSTTSVINQDADQERKSKAGQAEEVLSQYLLDTGHRFDSEAQNLTDSWISQAVNQELFFKGNQTEIYLEDYYSESADIYRMEAYEVDAFLDQILYFSAVNPYSPIGAVSTGFDDRYVYIAIYQRVN